MISSVILLAVVAYAHAQVHTVFYFGDNAQAILDDKKLSQTFMIPAGKCEMQFPLKEGYGCLAITALKIEVEDEDKVFIDQNIANNEGYVARLPGKCGSPATITFSKKCSFMPDDLLDFKRRPMYRPRGRDDLY